MGTTRKLTFADIEEMSARQNNKCGICGKEATLYRLAVDHCHVFGFVRGLLCGTCNTGIGMLRDNPDILKAAVVYLTDLPFALKDVQFTSRPVKPKATVSEKHRTSNLHRRRHAGPNKKLEICSCCGELLGVRERRKHGERSPNKSLGRPRKKPKEMKKKTGKPLFVVDMGIWEGFK